MPLPYIHYQACVYNRGNVPPGDWAHQPVAVGFPNSVLGVEALRFDVHQDGTNVGMRMRGYLSGVDELPWMNHKDGWLGRPASGEHLVWIALELTESDAAQFDIHYTACFSGKGFCEPARNGTVIGAIGDRIEAFSVWILPKS